MSDRARSWAWTLDVGVMLAHAHVRLSLLLLVAAMVASCMGYVPGRQTYWDAKVRELCAKDGGVKIFEQIVVSPSQAARLSRVGGFFGVAPEELTKPEDPAFTRLKQTVLREGNPSVIRSEEEIVRRADGRVVGVAIFYGRGGGDFPSYAHPSGFQCPEFTKIYEGIHNVYRVEETR